MTDDGSARPSTPEPDAAAHETRRALSNGLKLTLSLLATLVVAFAIRFWLPRALGPDEFGRLQFAEAFATVFFLVASFGIESYIGREVATRPAHAQDFLGGLVVVRSAIAAFAFAGIALTGRFLEKDDDVIALALWFGVWQLAFIWNGTVASLLQAHGSVDELSIVNALAKIAWGGGIAVGLVLGEGTLFVALVFVVTEVGKLVLLFPLALRRLGVRVVVDLRATLAALLASAPYFVNMLAHRVYDRIDIQMLSVLDAVDDNDAECGYYAAAANLALLGLLFLPIVNAVVLPMGARLHEISADALHDVMRAASRLVVAGGALVTLPLVLHADAWVALLFGADFAPAAPALRTLAPNFPLTYLAVLGSIHLIQMGRIWTVTRISVVGLVLNPALNYVLIPYGALRGPGGAGLASSAASVITEVVAVGLTLVALGRAGVDARLVRTVAFTALAVAATVMVHVALGGVSDPLDGTFLGRGLWRVPVEVLAFLAVAGASGALPLRALAARASSVVRRRREGSDG